MADWKLVSDQKVKKWELYNLPNDSTEMYDLAGKKLPSWNNSGPGGRNGLIKRTLITKINSTH